jgi:hypothetical protein
VSGRRGLVGPREGSVAPVALVSGGLSIIAGVCCVPPLLSTYEKMLTHVLVYAVRAYLYVYSIQPLVVSTADYSVLLFSLRQLSSTLYSPWVITLSGQSCLQHKMKN